MYIVINLF